MRARGFSLLEMLLVMAIIAFAGLLAASAMTGGFDGIRLRSASSEVAAQLRFTRAQAMATGRRQDFGIDPREHTWTAPKHRHGTLPNALTIASTSNDRVRVHVDMMPACSKSTGAASANSEATCSGNAAVYAVASVPPRQ